MLDVLLWMLFSSCIFGIAIGLSCTGGSCLGCCDICSDDFNRSDGSDIDTGSPCGWTERAGTWEISSNTLQSTGGGSNAYITCDTVHPDGDITGGVVVDIKHSTAGSACDVILPGLSHLNYYYVRFTINGASGSVEIRRFSGGSHSSIAGPKTYTLNTDTWYSVGVCCSEDGIISASINDSVVISADPATLPTGDVVGLGSHGTGTGSFDNFHFYKIEHTTDAEGCEPCTGYRTSLCNYCMEGVASQFYQVVITGSDSGQIDGTYVLERCGSLPSNRCSWQGVYEDIDIPCAIAHDASWTGLVIEIFEFSSGGGMTVLVYAHAAFYAGSCPQAGHGGRQVAYFTNNGETELPPGGYPCLEENTLAETHTNDSDFTECETLDASAVAVITPIPP